MRRILCAALLALVMGAGAAAAQPVALTVRRFDGDTGPVLVSSGIPLPPGLVAPGELARLHVTVGGRTQRVAVRALAGRWPDGSLRSVLVQFTYPVPPSGVTGVLALAVPGSRGTDLPLQPVTALPAAVALPASPAYLVASRWGGVLTPASERAATPLVATFDSEYLRIAAADWRLCGPAFDCGRTAGYDRPFILYQQWLRTGDPTAWYHATAAVADYRRRYVEPNEGAAPWWMNSESLALHYWATGDEMSRYQIRKWAEGSGYAYRPGSGYDMGAVPNYGDDRGRAKALSVMMDAVMLDIATQPADAPQYYRYTGATHVGLAPYMTPGTLPSYIAGVLASQQASGAFGGVQYQGGQKAYMVGMLLTALVRYYEEVSPDPRIPVAVRRALDDLWANEWSADTLGFRYVTRRVVFFDGSADDPVPEPGLNHMLLPAFAWYAAYSGDARYTAMADALMRGQHTTAWWYATSLKAFDQAYYRWGNVVAWRAGAPP